MPISNRAHLMVIAIIASILSAYLYSDDITSLTMILAVAAIGTVFLYILGVFRIRHMQLD